MGDHSDIDHTGLTGVGGAIDWGETGDITDQDYDDVADAGVLNEAARADHLHGMPSAGGGSSHGSSIDYDLGADVAVAAANTYTDAASGTPAAGTYDISWKVTCTANGSNNTGFKCILLAGATEIDYSEGYTFANERTTLNGFAFGVVLNGSTVVKTQMRANQTNTTISRNGGNGTNNDATKISLRKTH